MRSFPVLFHLVPEGASEQMLVTAPVHNRSAGFLFFIGFYA